MKSGTIISRTDNSSKSNQPVASVSLLPCERIIRGRPLGVAEPALLHAVNFARGPQDPTESGDLKRAVARSEESLSLTTTLVVTCNLRENRDFG
jgi:hypothetical protein